MLNLCRLVSVLLIYIQLNMHQEQYQETFETWNKLAELYQEKFMYLDFYNETYDFILQALPKPDAQILEVGCGPGNITKYLLSKNKNLHVLGIDVAPNMVELAQKNNPTANFQVLDCRSIGQLSQKFDAIIAGFCLPYLSYTDAEQFIQSCYALLNVNGIFYISFVEGDTNQSGFKTASTIGRAYFNYYELNYLESLLKKTGFNMIKKFVVPYPLPNGANENHTILITQK